MTKQYDEFMEELEEDIRRTKYLAIWNKYGKLITGGVIGALAIAAFAGLYYQRQQKLYVQESQQFVMAQQLLEAQQPKEALKIFENMGANSKTFYAVLSSFSEAAILRNQGGQESLKKAEAIYDKIIDNTRSRSLVLYRDFAILQKAWVSFTLDSKKFDIETLKNILNDKNPWYPLALELKGFYLVSKGEAKQAAQVFGDIVRFAKTPQGLSERSKLMAKYLANHNDAK